MPNEKFHYLWEFLWIFQFNVHEDQVLLRGTTGIHSIHFVSTIVTFSEKVSQDISN